MAKNINLCFSLLLILGALTACSQQRIPNSPTSQTSTTTQNDGDTTGENTASNGLSQPIVAPPSYNSRPLKPGEAAPSDTLPNGLPALKPLKGVNVDQLFAEKINDTDQRFDRVENVVKDLRSEFELVKPSIVRLVAVEQDIQHLVEQLEKIANEEKTHRPPHQNTDESMSADQAGLPTALTSEETQAEAKAIAAPLSKNSIKNFRTGIHKGKIRLVFDLDTKPNYTVDLDSDENILIIEIADANWTDAPTKQFGAKTPILKSYTAQPIPTNSGTRIIIDLKQTTSILKSDIIMPSNTNAAHRLYIDLKR